MNLAEWMNGICLLWSRGRLISPSLPVGDDRYLNLSSQKRPTGRNLGGNRLVLRSGTTSRGTVVLVFCLRMRRFLLTVVLIIFVGMKGIDLFSLYILFSHFRPRDATRGNSFFQMSSYARANLRITNEKNKRKIPMRASRGLKWENKMYKLKRSIS